MVLLMLDERRQILEHLFFDRLLAFWPAADTPLRSGLEEAVWKAMLGVQYCDPKPRITQSITHELKSRGVPIFDWYVQEIIGTCCARGI